MLRLVRHLIHKFNADPTFQFHFHLVGTICGLVVMVMMPITFFLLHHVWQSISILALVLITDYGNGVTDYCGVSDAEASGHGAALRGIRASAVHHNFAGRIFDKLALDPKFQYKLHLILTYNWIVQGAVAIAVFFLAPVFWAHYAILYTLLQNGYTNFGTDFSALPGTLAARHLQTLRKGKSPWEAEELDTER